MKKIPGMALSVILLMSAVPMALAADKDTDTAGKTAATSATTLKIGVVDIRKVLQKSSQVATAQKQIKNQFQSRDKDFKALQQQVRADADKLNRDGSVMKDADRKALQQKIQDEQQKLQSMQVSLQQDLFAAQNQQMQSIMAKLQNAVNQVAKKGQFTLILTKDNVAYAAQQYDVTDQVADALSDQK